MLKYIPHHLTKLCPKIGGAVTSKEQLPAGIRRTPQGLQVDMEKLKPGMRPVKVVSPNGVTYIDESCARSETNTGDVHWHWRDGRLESQMRRFSRIALHSDVAVARRESVQLVNGHVLNWHFVPSGSLHITFDAMGKMIDAECCGLKVQISNDGVMTVLGDHRA